MAAIFISYRRQDCPAHAGRLADALIARFGEASVFMDVDAIELGVDFVARIEQAVGDCDVVLALIGHEWLTAKDRDGRRRLDQPDDFVRLELSHGLARKDVRVVPVLVEGAEMPSAADLPDDLVGLTRRNGFTLSDVKWHSDAAVLIEAIDRVVDDEPAPSAPDRRPETSGSAPSSLPWTVLALCGLAGLWFVFIGWRLRKKGLLIIGVLYSTLALFLVLFSLGDVEVLILWPFVMAPSAIHYFAIRPRYSGAG
jgi:hypothetical protein